LPCMARTRRHTLCWDWDSLVDSIHTKGSCMSAATACKTHAKAASETERDWGRTAGSAANVAVLNVLPAALPI